MVNMHQPGFSVLTFMLYMLAPLIGQSFSFFYSKNIPTITSNETSSRTDLNVLIIYLTEQNITITSVPQKWNVVLQGQTPSGPHRSTYVQIICIQAQQQLWHNDETPIRTECDVLVPFVSVHHRLF